MGDLTTCIPEALGYHTTLSYIQQKHNIDDGTLENINLDALHVLLSSLPISCIHGKTYPQMDPYTCISMSPR